jgi:4-hydroxythreonine-4-phosphate dehydrogenase
MALAVSIGCPAGIGPEVAVVAAGRAPEPVVLVGDRAVVERAAEQRRVSRRRLVLVADAAGIARLRPGRIGLWAGATELGSVPAPGRPDREAGAAQLAWIDEATELVRAGWCRALVTGPVSKQVIARSGGPAAAHFLGHTEHLARRLGAREVVMSFVSDRLATALVTTHLPIAAVPAAVTPAAVACACFHFGHMLARLRGSAVRITVAALNPHAGEGGLLGREERERIVPGMRRGRARLARRALAVELSGPVGAETAYRLAAAGEYQGVVAMYHDQATIACKLLDFGESVNVTLGLPLVRTSVDHGTGYDLAGTGRASAAGMLAALRLAARLAG